MLADVGAGSGEGIVLADEPHSVGAAALVHQGDVAGDVHASGAQGHTGHGVAQAAQAAVVEDVLLIVVPEALQTHEHKIGGVDADGAVGGVHDDLGGVFNAAQDADAGLPVQDFPDHVGELGQADAAGYALAAGLSLAEIQKIQSHVHGAQARRAGGDPPFHVPVQLLHHSLCLTGGFYFESAHVAVHSFPSEYARRAWQIDRGNCAGTRVPDCPWARAWPRLRAGISPDGYMNRV